MDALQIQDTLAAWAALMMRCEAQIDALTTLTGADTESPFLRPITDLMAAHTRSVGTLVGDPADWLEWYWCENDLGAKGLPCGPAGQERPITCTEELAWAMFTPVARP